MDIEIIKLIAQIIVLPCIGLGSALMVAIISGWVTFQFSKSLENYKRALANTPANAINEPKLSQSTTKEKAKTDDEAFSDWIAKAMRRGAVALANLFAFIIGTAIVFIIIHPFGITFIYNRISELMAVPFFHQIYSEVTQFFSIELLANLYLLCMSMIGGLFATLFSNMIIDATSWIFDLKLNT